jgi:hypothetical protein
MACSKIFSGDLPELISEIIQYFQNDYKTLHSCSLVNRLWCHLAIPLLWEDPFSIPTISARSYNFIGIYLHNLNDNDKKKLNEYGINYNLLPSNTLFNYPRFIKCLNLDKINLSVEKWVTNRALITKNRPAISAICFVFKLLFKTFTEDENKVNLHTFEFEIKTYTFNENFNIIYELILQNPNFLRNINNFKFSGSFSHFNIFGANIDPFLNLQYSNCNLISSFNFKLSENAFINRYISQLINSQQNLEKIMFNGHTNNKTYYSLLSLKSHKHSKSLKTIVFHHVNFINKNDLNEVFEQLNVLGSVHILYCNSLNYFIQQIINITRSLKLNLYL